MFAGLIHLALPNAIIIHTTRDPLDTCLSCFSILFSAEQNHTYDLAELGRYYRHYRALMAHCTVYCHPAASSTSIMKRWWPTWKVKRGASLLIAG